ncbi:MAG TPA: hypothetical protein VGE07_05030 [Herpetosiphonaceae bacterium]
MNAENTEKMYADAADNARAEQPATRYASEDDFNWDTWWGEYHMDAHEYEA